MNTSLMNSSKSYRNPVRQRVAGLWKLLKKRPALWQVEPEEVLVQLEFGFAGDERALGRRKTR
jgi:hypothetical protein